MKESYKQGLATQFGLESCAVVREDEGEALTEVRAGRVLSCEMYAPTGNRLTIANPFTVEHGVKPEEMGSSSAGFCFYMRSVWLGRMATCIRMQRK
jgi:hypothetical protein